MRVDYIYIDNNREAEKAAEFLITFPRLGLDTETTGLEVISGISKPLLVQLGTEESTYLFDARKVNLEILRPILESHDILKVLHNAKFDYQVLRIAGNIVVRNMFDTMLAYRLLTSGLIEDGRGGYIPAGFRDKSKRRFPYKSLNFLTQKYLGISLDKSVRETFVNHQYTREYTTEQLRYAAQDIVVLQPLCDLLSQELMEEDLIETAMLEFQFIRPVAEMEINGIYINTEKWRQIIGEAERQAKNFAKEIASILEPLSEQNSLFGASTVNIDSQEQLLTAFRRLGFEVTNTDQKVLKSVKHPLAKLILDYRAYNKLVSTYGEAILKKINRTTERLHFTLHQLGADTGRLSSENPNIQNMPNDKDDPDAEVAISFRDCFEASPGNVVLTADYSQCIPVEEWICTQYGLRQLKDCAKVGVRVPDLEGIGTVPVEAYLPKGTKETITLRTSDGFEVSATKDHRILTDQGWIPAGHLIGGHHFLVLSRDWLAQNPELSDRDANFCEMLGYWSGDGSFSSGGVQFAKTEDKYYDVYALLNSIAKSCFGKELKDYSGTTAWDLIGKAVQKEFERWGCAHSKAGSKQIPSLVLQTGRQGVASYLRGLFEADGWITSTEKNVVAAFSTRSANLSRQVQMLLLGLGIFSKRAAYEEETSVGGREYIGTQYRVSICDELNLSLFEQRVGFMSLLKRELLSNRRRNRIRSNADKIILAEEEIQALRTLAEKSDYWPEMRREFFANYYNTSQGKIRDYTRDKLYALFCRYETEAPTWEYAHKAFSQVSFVGNKKVCEVADLSVPTQKAFSAGGVFVHNCELRIFAEVSQDAKFLSIFRNDQDLHIITSQEVFGYTDADLAVYNKVKSKDKPDTNLEDFFTKEEITVYKAVGDYRTKTKAINFGIAYGLSAFSLADRFKIPMEEAEKILDNYFRTYSGIKRWLDFNAHETIANRYAKTILGRKKYFTLANPANEEEFRRSRGATRRMGNNHVIQGSNADITKEALVRLQEAYDKIPGARLLFTVHDEIVSECPEEIAEQVSVVKAEIMKEAFHKFIKTVPVGKGDKVSVTIAKHWSK